jgi:FAD dependent oxidoreductase
MPLFYIRQLLAIGLVSVQSLAAFSQMTLHDPLPDQFQAIFSPPPESASESFPVSNPSRSFWTDGAPGVNPLARAGSTGPLTSDADICVIGSGITGVSVAYHLSKLFENNATSQDALSVVVLEARDFC